MTKMEKANRSGKPAADRIGVLVLGMHRSGTSALSRALNLLGCDLPKTLMAAHPSNEVGHWESLLISHLNDEILSSAGSEWHDWLAFNPGWYASPKAAEYKEMALAALEEEFGRSRLFVLKDPRICRFAPFWIDVLESAGVRPVIIMPVRNPLEVAASLSARDGFDPALGHLLWLRHVLEAEAGSRGMRRFHTSYEGLLTAWQQLAVKGQERLGVSWPRLSPLTGGEIDAFLTDRLRHHWESPKSVSDNPLLSAWLREAFAIFNRWADEGEAAEDYAALDRIRAQLDAAAPAFARLISAGKQSARKVKALDASLKETHGKLAEAEAATEAQQLQVDVLERHLDETRTALSASEATAEQKEREIAEAASRLAEARSQLDELQTEAQLLRTTLEQARGDLSQAQSEVAQRRAEADDATAELQRAEKRHAEELEAERANLTARFDEIASLSLLLKEREADASVALERSREEADRAARLASELEAERSRASAEVQKLRQEKSAAEGRVTERFSEIAIMTRMLGESEDAARASDGQAAWLREVTAVLLNCSGSSTLKGRLAALLPAPIRLKKQKARLQRTGMFDPAAYLAAHPDVAEAGLDPLWHYINHGIGEGRQLHSTQPMGEHKGDHEKN